MSQADADATWSAAKASLVPVLIIGDMGWILAEDEPAFTQRDAPLIEHVRFLARGDPYIHRHAGPRLPGVPKDVTDRLRRAGVASRRLNSVSGGF